MQRHFRAIQVSKLGGGNLRLLGIAAVALVCAVVATAAPSITGVYNAGSWIPVSLPNSGVAQGAIFTITGTGLGPATLQEVQSYPLPTTQGLAGTTVTVKVGSVTETCIMVYTVASQIAAILPSATPVGTGTLTVSYQGTNGSIPIQVVAGDFGMFTLNEGGTGPAVVTDFSYNPITLVNAAHPGDNLVLWGTGLGAVSGDETEPPAAVNFPGVQVLIGNQPAVVNYAGRSSSPGLDQINVTVPAGISGGCKTSILVIVNGIAGNAVSTAIAPPGQTTCGDTFGALTADDLTEAVSKGSLNIAAVDLTRVGSLGDDTLDANFSSYPLNSLIRSYAGSLGPSIGSCIAYEQLGGTTLLITDPIFNLGGLAPVALDSGPALTITPQGRSQKVVDATSTGSYAAVLGTTGNSYLTPGVYGIANGNGGAQVAAFNWTDTLPDAVSFTNLPTTINRAQDLTVTWTSSAAFSLVSIFGFSGVPVTSTQISYVEFICTTSASANQFTIPAAILSLLPTNGFGLPGVPGVGMEVAGIVVNRFTVAGNPGIDAGVFSMFTSTGSVVKVQ
jgi:uncharacterized protein (TIGR03437 family)